MSYVFASMDGYTPSGDGWRIGYALDQGVKEVGVRFPRVTSVGVKGDDRHQAQFEYSAHNPLITAPDGTMLVLATDLVGPQEDLDAIRDLIEAKYNARDRRQFPFGFTQMNGYGTVWDDDPHTKVHFTDADYGHLHWNINTVTFPIQDNYRAFMDDISPWGIDVPKVVVPSVKSDYQIGDEPMLFQREGNKIGLLVLPGGKGTIITRSTDFVSIEKSGVPTALISAPRFDRIAQLSNASV